MKQKIHELISSGTNLPIRVALLLLEWPRMSTARGNPSATSKVVARIDRTQIEGPIGRMSTVVGFTSDIIECCEWMRWCRWGSEGAPFHGATPWQCEASDRCPACIRGEHFW